MHKLEFVTLNLFQGLRFAIQKLREGVAKETLGYFNTYLRGWIVAGSRLKSASIISRIFSHLLRQAF